MNLTDSFKKEFRKEDVKMNENHEKALSYRQLSRSEKTVRMVKMAMLVAISMVLVAVIHIPFPPAPFLVYDPADIPIFIGTFAFGPGVGLLITLVACLFQSLMFGSGGPIGFTMHLFATGGFVLVAGLLYRRRKTRKNAVLALIAGVLTMTVTMVIWNVIFTPIFMGTSVKEVLPMLLPIIVPFNLLKAGINSLVTFLTYKSIAKYLHR